MEFQRSTPNSMQEVIASPTAVELALALDNMTHDLDMDKTVIDAAKADTLLLHETGLRNTDVENCELIVNDGIILVNNILKRCKEIGGVNNDPRLSNRRAQRIYERRKFDARIQLTATDLRVLESDAKLGMFSSSRFRYLYLSDRIHYFFDPRPEQIALIEEIWFLYFQKKKSQIKLILSS